jgi:tRNA A-37 threonylcarbamoyl transferase component Bud32
VQGELVAGRYEIVGVLGEGSFGIVYHGIHRVIGRRVAVKILREDLNREPELVQRFQLEARAAGALGHPNIVQIFDAGQIDGGSHFLVMELVEGESLAAEIARGPLDIARAVDIGAQILSGLAAAHRRSIVHRDLKPENVLLGRDEDGREVAKVADFGISKVLDPVRLGAGPIELRKTGHGQLLGTPLYMAPEQARGDSDVDHRADLWAVGCVLYEMMCGRPPYVGESFVQILSALLADPPLMPGTLRAEVTPAIEAVIMTALAKDRAARPADATRMRAMLLEAAGQAAPPSPRAVDDDPMVAALSRAVALELADGGGGSFGPPPAPVAPEPKPTRPVEPVDVFAPPEAAVPLTLDVDRSAAPIRTSQTRAVLDPRPRPVALAPPRRFPFATILLVLLVLGAGATAGYRYLTLGYLWRPSGGPVKVELVMVPPDADVTIDGEPLGESRLELPEGRRVLLVARAPERQTVKRTLTGVRGMSPRLEVRLPNALRPIAHIAELGAPAEPIAALSPPTGEPAEVDQALSKLDLYRSCLGLIGRPLAAAQAAYQGSSRRAQPEVTLLATTQRDQCRADVERARGRSPDLGPIDAAATGFLEALVALDSLSRRLDTYYSTGEHRVDGRRFGKKNHAALLEAYRVALARGAGLLELVERSTSDWQAHEHSLMADRDGPLGRLRRVALVARRRARAELKGTDDRAEASAELGRALDAAGQVPDASKVMIPTPPDGSPPADWIAWHDRLVAAFNRLEVVR